MLGIFKAVFGGTDNGTGLLTDASDQFLSMLSEARELLESAEPYLLSSEAPEDLADRARTVDKRSNKAERTIRKMLVETLSFDKSNGPLCLVLMSVAKDGERLVDECRNLLDLADLIKEPVPTAYADDLHARAKQLIESLKQTHDAFRDNDQRVAIELVEGEKPFIAELGTIQDRIFDDASLTRAEVHPGVARVPVHPSYPCASGQHCQHHHPASAPDRLCQTVVPGRGQEAD